MSLHLGRFLPRCLHRSSLPYPGGAVSYATRLLATATGRKHSKLHSILSTFIMERPFVLDQMEQVVALIPPQHAERIRAAVRSLRLLLGNLQGLEGEGHTHTLACMAERKHAHLVQIVRDASTPAQPKPSQAPWQALCASLGTLSL